MEPTDLKNELPDDAQLEAWYRAHLVIPPLRDDGFSPRVLAALPTPARRSAAQRRLFCLVGALLGTVIALVQTIGAGSRTTNLAAFEIKSGDGLTQLANPAFCLALAIALISLWFVFRPKLRVPSWLSRPPTLTGR